MTHLIPPLVTILWMIGGQVAKAARRYGAPGVTVLILVAKLLKEEKLTNKDWWKYLVFLLYIPLLSVGYGVDSSFGRVFKKELTIRAMYAIMLSFPLALFTLSTHNWGRLVLATIALIFAFQVRDKWFGPLQKKLSFTHFDILIEDLFRGMTLGYCIVWIAS